jgi:hypothetical protein
MNRTPRIFVSLIAAFLVACGGGGVGDSTSASASGASVGLFLDGPVAGIGYRTATQSGVTNARGEYFYLPGETVTFFIGSIELPPVLAKGFVTPLDIANTHNIDHQTVSNILVFLQSLDADGNHGNGITISPVAATRATATVDFTVSPAAFAANAVVTNLIANSGSVTQVLISASTAKANFQNTLNGSDGGTRINIEPIANAGPSQSVATGATATLVGSASTDANNDTLTFAWTLIHQPGGSLAALSSASSVTASLVPDVPGTYVASLVVNDGLLSSPAATTTLTVTTPPDLEAIPDLGDYPLTAGQAFTISLPSNVVTVRNPDLTITVEARFSNGQPLPAWLKFDPQALEFSGAPPAGFSGRLSFEVIFRDQYGNRASSFLDLMVTSGPAPVR